MACLPDDVLYMVCTQLWHERDFDTLFNCACSGKQLATLAMKNLYRIQGVAPDNNNSDEQMPALGRLGRINLAHTRRLSYDQILIKCASLWRTIILSSLGKTLYPYSQYVRALNLRDLENLLTDSKFRVRDRKDFFQGELAQFKVNRIIANKRHPRLDADEIINRIGEVITKQTPMLEVLTGKVLSGALSRWIPRLPRLTHVKLWDGASVEGNGNLIRLHCPSFKRIDFWDWNGLNCNQGLAAFLNELRPQSLESFETFSQSQLHNLGPEIFQALSCHGESLIKLTLTMIRSDNIPKLSLLKGCTNLVSLSLGGYEREKIDLRRSNHNAFLETVAWLKECKKLRILAIATLFSGSALMTSILLETTIRLTSLEYEGFATRDTTKFHQALANQTSLQSLWLKECFPALLYPSPGADDALVESLSKLVNLTNLRLTDLSNNFGDRHIVQLANSLPNLEVWSTRGFELTDAIWGEVASLRSLRRLDLGAVATFTADGILDFIKKLGPGNKGLVLSVMNVNMSFWVEQDSIQKKFAEQVQGRLDFTLDRRHWTRRDPEMSSYQGESYSLNPDMSSTEDESDSLDPEVSSSGDEFDSLISEKASPVDEPDPSEPKISLTEDEEESDDSEISLSEESD